METPPLLSKDGMAPLLSNRINRAMLADNNGNTNTSGNTSAPLPDPPRPR